MKEENIVIWGAGRIGRGFIADLFQEGGYSLTFIDADEIMVKKLNENKSYKILRITGKDESTEVIIKNYRALSTKDKDTVEKVLENCKLLAICVFPNIFDIVASSFINEIERRALENSNENLDILVCANINHPSDKFKACFDGKLSPSAQKYFKDKIGFIDSAVIRMAIEASPEQKLQDELIVVTNGYKQMPVDGNAFKGHKPKVPNIIFVENMRAEEMRKMYTYNMMHALYSYVGQAKGHTYVYECTQDIEVQKIAELALDEVCQALIKEFGYTFEEMVSWKITVLKNMANPTFMDKLVRVGSDPERKLKREDRLVGPALLCRKHGLMPYYLAKGIAGAFVFNNPGDLALERIKKYLELNGIKETIKEICQLNKEVELIQLINDQYNKYIDKSLFSEDSDKIEIIKKAYELGFKYEKTYKGCAQCTLAALFEVTGKTNEILFKAASALSGGIAITGDGSCGGYTGGVLYMGSQIGRRIERIPVDGDKIDQYRSYEMAQKLHDKYIETYGSVTCSDIHKVIFDKSYCLRTKAVRDEFEAAGAHADKCTTVIAMTSSWVAEIMYEEKCLNISDIKGA
ncbi:hypothetical protein MASR2M78_13010 [Treponema sp.]